MQLCRSKKEVSCRYYRLYAHGFGYAIAEELFKAGARVVISGRSQSSIKRALNNLQADGSRVAGIPCEVSDETKACTLTEKPIESDTNTIALSSFSVEDMYSQFVFLYRFS